MLGFDGGFVLLAAKGSQKENWQEACKWYQKSLNIWQEMKAKGMLSSADVGKLDEIARKIAKAKSVLSSVK